ncbi:MAG: glycoside hydrolase family 88/105 protein [Sediminibacterium sp.]
MNIRYKVLFFLFLPTIFQACIVVQKTTKSKTTQDAMLKAMQWQEAHPIFAKAPTDWTNGAYYVGVVKAHEATQKNEYLEALKSMAIRNNWKPWERFYHADDMNICYSYLYLNALGESHVNIVPTSVMIKDHLFKPYPWKNDGSERVKGKNETDEKKILWWWCDALFMAPPVIVNYAKQMNEPTYLKEMDKYYVQAYELLYDKKAHLFSRDARFLLNGKENDIREQNGEKVFWARGNGWVLAGLALMLNDLPKDYPTRKFYENLFVEMAEKIKLLQPADGLWRTSLLSPESFDHGEVSGSGFFTFALAWGINNGYLKQSSYKPVVVKAWKAISACQQENGKVGWVQNIGANPMPANADSWQNFGTGAFLMAGSEILKLK